jgi:hypothetical protein
MEALGEWRYSSSHSLTSSLDGGEQLHAPAALPPRKEPLVPSNLNSPNSCLAKGKR